MAFYQTILADRIVGAVASTSPGTGWTTVANVQTLINNARAANLPLHLKPGTYTTNKVDVLTSNGGGNPLILIGASGTVIVQLASVQPYLLSVSGVYGTNIENIIFDGGNITLNDTGSQFPAVVRFSGDITYQVRNCVFRNSPFSGISATAGAHGIVTHSQFFSLRYGFTTLDCGCTFEKNRVVTCTYGGIYVWTTSAYAIQARIADNFIQNIQNVPPLGSGEYGNGISIYRAGGVSIVNNTIYQCALSAIRINGGSNCQVLGNRSWSSGDAGIFLESPGADVATIGHIVANNIIDAGFTGINAANVGMYGDGVTRRITIANNQITNATTVGIIGEGGVTFTGNSVENCPIGISAGTNDAAFDLTVTGNFLRNCKMGIGYSWHSSAVGMLVSGNEISGYVVSTNPADPAYPQSGAIVAVAYDPAHGKYRTPNGSSPNTDYGNATQTVVGGLTVGMNKARV